MLKDIKVKFSEKNGTWFEIVDFTELLNKLIAFVQSIVEAEFDFNV